MQRPANNFVDLKGCVFNNRQILGRVLAHKKKVHWLVVCLLCDKFKIVRTDNVKEQKCTCNSRTHGLSKTSEYKIWLGIKYRCFNEKCSAYIDYGGRGITVCDRWLSFENFYEDMGARPVGQTLERVDNDGNYCPENCEWADYSKQNKNRRKLKTSNTRRQPNRLGVMHD